MVKEKAHIIVMKNSVPIGYIESVQLSKRTFKITKDKSKAKGYATRDRIEAEIDKLAEISLGMGMTFLYD